MTLQRPPSHLSLSPLIFLLLSLLFLHLSITPSTTAQARHSNDPNSNPPDGNDNNNNNNNNNHKIHLRIHTISSGESTITIPLRPSPPDKDQLVGHTVIPANERLYAAEYDHDYYYSQQQQQERPDIRLEDVDCGVFYHHSGRRNQRSQRRERMRQQTATMLPFDFGVARAIVGEARIACVASV